MMMMMMMMMMMCVASLPEYLSAYEAAQEGPSTLIASTARYRPLGSATACMAHGTEWHALGWQEARFHCKETASPWPMEQSDMRWEGKKRESTLRKLQLQGNCKWPTQHGDTRWEVGGGDGTPWWRQRGTCWVAPQRKPGQAGPQRCCMLWPWRGLRQLPQLPHRHAHELLQGRSILVLGTLLTSPLSRWLFTQCSSK